MELGAEINIRCRSPQVGAEVTRAEHRLPRSLGKVTVQQQRHPIQHGSQDFHNPSFLSKLFQIFRSSQLGLPRIELQKALFELDLS